MIELVMVIVVLGILAATAIPRLDRDLSQEASDTILSYIRYTQHLALSDFKQEFNDPKWQMGLWKISFEKCSDPAYFIGIGSDVGHGGDIDYTEAAVDPVNGKAIFWENTKPCANGGDNNVSDNIFITKKFGIKNFTSSGGCNNKKYIAFDHLGRPHTTLPQTPEYGGYMNSICTFTFTMNDNTTFSIKILPETGFAYIDGQPDS